MRKYNKERAIKKLRREGILPVQGSYERRKQKKPKSVQTRRLKKKPNQPELFCFLCKRSSNLTRHHLIPKQHSDRTPKGNPIKTCVVCHTFIHLTFNNYQLKYTYNTASMIKNHRDIIVFVDWFKDKNLIITDSRTNNKKCNEIINRFYKDNN